jgi:hypothetical protein
MIGLFSQTTNTAQNEDSLFKCVKWTYNVCLEWKPLDCSKRLHVEICKAEGTKLTPKGKDGTKK